MSVLSTALTSMQGTVTRGVETAGTHLTLLISAAFTRLLKTVVSMLAAPALGVDASTIAQQRLSVAALRALSLPLLGADGGLCLADVGLPAALAPLLAWGASVEGLLGTGECIGDVAHRLVACVDTGSGLRPHPHPSIQHTLLQVLFTCHGAHFRSSQQERRVILSAKQVGEGRVRGLVHMLLCF